MKRIQRNSHNLISRKIKENKQPKKKREKMSLIETINQYEKDREERVRIWAETQTNEKSNANNSEPTAHQTQIAEKDAVQK